MDGDGMLNVNEFAVVLRSLQAAIPPDEAAELRKFLDEVGDNMDEVTEIFREVNKSKSGLITIEECALPPSLPRNYSARGPIRVPRCQPIPAISRTAVKSCEFFEEDD